MEFLDGIIDRSDVSLKRVLVFFEVLVPKHGEVSFEVGLGGEGVLDHFEVGSSVLSG